MRTALLVVGREAAARRWAGIAGAAEAARVAGALERRLRVALGTAAALEADTLLRPGIVEAARVAEVVEDEVRAGMQHVLLVAAHVTAILPVTLRTARARLEEGADLAIAATPWGDAGIVALRADARALLDGVPWGDAGAVGALRDRAHEGDRRAVSCGPVAGARTWAEALEALPAVSVVRDTAVRAHGSAPDPVLCARRHGLVLESIDVGRDADAAGHAGTVLRAAGEGLWSAGARAAEGAWLWLPHPHAALDDRDVERVAAFVQRPTRPWARLDGRPTGAVAGGGRGLPALRRVRRPTPPGARTALLVRRSLLDSVGGIGHATHDAPDDLERRLRRAARPARRRVRCVGGERTGDR